MHGKGKKCCSAFYPMFSVIVIVLFTEQVLSDSTFLLFSSCPVRVCSILVLDILEWANSMLEIENVTAV